MFAFARVYKLPDRAAIEAATRHAFATPGAKVRRRKDATGPRAFALHRDAKGRWVESIVYPHGHPETDGDDPPEALDYTRAFDAHLKRHDADVPPNAHAGQHLIMGVSPEYFDLPGTGDPHDADSPGVRKLTRAAVEWADKALGGVWAARYDVDERGSGVVDVLISPVHTNRKTGTERVSVRKSQEALRKRVGGKRSYSSMQSDWAPFVSKRLGVKFRRGRPKDDTAVEHVIAEKYGEIKDAGRAEMVALRAEVAALKRRVKKLEDALKRKVKRIRDLTDTMTDWAVGVMRRKSRPSMPPDPEPEEVVLDAIKTMSKLNEVVQPNVPAETHERRIAKKLYRGAMSGGWNPKNAVDAPLHVAYQAAVSSRPEADRPLYDDWIRDLAHENMRGKSQDERDLMSLARSIGKAQGWYLTRRQRKRLRDREAAEAAEVAGDPGGRPQVH